MTYIKLIFFWLLLFSASVSYGQQPDSVIVLKQVEIIATRILEKQTETRSTQVIKKAVLKTYSTSTLNDLLSKNTNITINQYGTSGLSSVSMRGGNANHTAVLWNGFNIQDPLNGEFNLSLSTIGIIDEISINYGGASALFGSGAVGGTISLANKAKYDSKFGIGVQQSFGSFGKQNSIANISYGTKKLYLKTRVFYSYIENDFEYENRAKKDYPIETLQNSAVKQYGILQEAYYKINYKNELNAQVWYQNNYSEIAPNMTISNGFATQYDEFLRIATSYKRKGEKIDLEVRNGFFTSKLNFIKPEINLDATHTALNNITEAIVNYKLNKKNLVLLGTNNNYIISQSDNFNKTESLNKIAFFISHKFHIKNKFFITSNIRTEAVNTAFKPITYGLKAEYYINKQFSANTNISKNYRTPNFNDLYWMGPYAKGNSQLKDEDGYSMDLGINHRINKEKFSIETNLTSYYSKFSNLIHWQSEGTIWSPQNKKLVVSKGIEFRTNSSIKITKNLLTFININ